MHKNFWAGFGGQLAGVLLQLAVLGVVGLLIWRKIFGGKTAEAVVGNVIDSAASIPGGVASMIGSRLRGESEVGYISQAQAKINDAIELARARGQGA